MNWKLVVFSGIITAVIGAVLGISASEISKGDLRQLKYQSEFYQELNNKYYTLIGAGLGLAVGVGQECLRELNKQKEKEQQLLEREKLERYLK